MTHFRRTAFTAAAAGLLILAVLAAAPGELQAGDNISIRPFTVRVPQTAIDDPRQCLVATRWPGSEEEKP